MLQGDAAKKCNPFRLSQASPFVCGEPQEEALARIEYLQHHGAGWCLVAGPLGIGKSMVLNELARRSRSRGHGCLALHGGSVDSENWLTVVADAWRIPIASGGSPTELRRRLEEHLTGLAAINRPVWILIDQAETLSPEWVRGCRWLISLAASRQLSLTIVVAECDGTDTKPAPLAVDLRLELWPWDEADCERYVTQCLQATGTPLAISPDAIAALHERTAGVPGELSKLCEWTWLAAQAESLEFVDADLVHAVADELSPSAPPRSTYDHSAAYGAW